MLRRSNIGWCDFSGADLNFIIGCTPVSEGCANCYAHRLIEGRQGRDFSEVRLYHEKLDRLSNAVFEENGAPFRRGPGSRPIAFPVDLGDLFHPAVPDEFILDALRLMAGRCDVDWAILTKRVERMAEFDRRHLRNGFPSNIWVGVTVENQKRADERVRKLLRVRATVRWVSLEPMLGPVDLGCIPYQGDTQYYLDVLRGRYSTSPSGYGNIFAFGLASLNKVSWVVVGAESGPNRRPFDLDWARQVRDDCLAANVPFFYKQGSHLYPGRNDKLDGRRWKEFPHAP